MGAWREAWDRDPRDWKERDWCLNLARGRGVATPGPHSIPYVRGSVGIAAPMDRTQADRQDEVELLHQTEEEGDVK